MVAPEPYEGKLKFCERHGWACSGYGVQLYSYSLYGGYGLGLRGSYPVYDVALNGEIQNDMEKDWDFPTRLLSIIEIWDKKSGLGFRTEGG